MYFENLIRSVVSASFLLILTKVQAQQTVSEAVRMQTAEAQRAAIKLYPALADSSSDLNEKFVAMVKTAHEKHDPIFSDPKWPLIIADRLADKEGIKQKAVPRNEYGLEVDSDGVPYAAIYALKDALKDPDSVQIKSCKLTKILTAQGLDFVFKGDVKATILFNSKNSYGGYGNNATAIVNIYRDGKTSCIIAE